MRKILIVLTLFVAAIGLSNSVHALPMIVSDGSPAGNRDTWTGTVGTQFTIGADDVFVNALGFEDAGGDGLVLSHQVGLWQADGTLLASVTVPAGTSGFLIDTWRFVRIGAYIKLSAGATYILAAETINGSGDPFTDQSVPDFSLDTGILDANPTNVYASVSFTFPTSNGGGTDLRWAPANATKLEDWGCSAIEGTVATSLAAGDFFGGVIGTNAIEGINKNGKPVSDTDGDGLTDSFEQCINDALIGYCSTIEGDEEGDIEIVDFGCFNFKDKGNQCNRSWFIAEFVDVGSCAVTECSDRIDTDGDADGNDYPDDPDCDDYDDNDESG